MNINTALICLAALTAAYTYAERLGGATGGQHITPGMITDGSYVSSGIRNADITVDRQWCEDSASDAGLNHSTCAPAGSERRIADIND